MGVTQQFTILCAISSVACTFATEAKSLDDPSNWPSFSSFVAKHRRAYREGSEEYQMRHNLYQQRLEQITQHNSKPKRRWNAAVNHLSDRTELELAQLRGLRVMQTSNKGARTGVVGIHNYGGQFLSQVRSTVVAEEKTWEHLDAVKQEVNQEACGSCWAIAASTMLQANAEIYGHNRTWSAQEMVDCTPNPHNCGGEGGCKGATVELGMNWVMEKGLDTSEGTPYKGEDAQCKKGARGAMLIDNHYNDKALNDMIAVGFHPAKSQSSPVLQLGLLGWERLPENEYEPVIRAIAERGPVAVSVSASAWSYYGGGLFDSCSSDAVIDHAVTLIGYGTDRVQKEKYWLVKNSWGNTWGEGGNIRLLREEGNVHCGTDNQPKVGTGCDGGPPAVKVCGMCGILYDTVVPHFKK